MTLAYRLRQAIRRLPPRPPMADVSSEVLRQRPWHTATRQCTGAPWGLLGNGEGHLLYYLARDYYRGKGVIVDAGSFLGRSAWFLARGIEANPHLAGPPGPIIHCFDNFLVNEARTIKHIKQQFRVVLPLGASTRHLFDTATRPIAQWLSVHEGDFHTYPWPPSPIEILFVDVAKSAALHRRLVELMFPCLIPGRSVVVHQDYHHPWLPYLHVAMEYLHEYFEIVEPKIDDSAAFICTRSIPEDALRIAARIEDLPQAERLTLMDRAVERLPRDCRTQVELARAYLIGQEQGFEAMHAALEAADGARGTRKEAAAWQAERAGFLEELRWDLNYGWRLVEAGKLAEALALAAAVPSDDPRYPDALLLSVHCLRRLDRLAEAGDAIQLAAAQQPDNPAVWIEQAWLDLVRRHGSAALTSARRAVDNIPTRPDQEPHAFHVLSAALSAIGEHDDALSFNTRALASNPAEPGILRQQMRCLERVGRLDEAATIASRVLAQDPNEPLALRIVRQVSPGVTTAPHEVSVGAVEERALDAQDLDATKLDVIRAYVIDIVMGRYSNAPPRPIATVDDLRAALDAAQLVHAAGAPPSRHDAFRRRLQIITEALAAGKAEAFVGAMQQTTLAAAYTFLAFSSDDEFAQGLADGN